MQQCQFQQSPPFLLPAQGKPAQPPGKLGWNVISVSTGPCPSLLCQHREPEQPDLGWLLHTDSSDGSQGSTGQWGTPVAQKGQEPNWHFPMTSAARAYPALLHQLFCKSIQGILTPPDALVCLAGRTQGTAGHTAAQRGLGSLRMEDFPSCCSNVFLTCRPPTQCRAKLRAHK